jgi:ZIP family zinc transporter
VSLSETLLLGFIAGITILIGLPLGRLRSPLPRLRLLLNAVAVGILIFLVWDVLSHAWEPIDTALSNFHENNGSLAPAFGYGALFFGGLAVGLLSLVAYEQYMGRLRGRVRGGPGAMSVDQLRRPTLVSRLAGWSDARQLALLIAVGIGLHNFAEGLAIGQSAGSGDIALATLLVIGFAAHNATEGFGIVAPLAADREENEGIPSWGLLLTLGVIGGGPTFLGTWLGHGYTSDALSVVFLTLAAGSILFVIIQLLGVAAKARRMDLVCYGVLIGMIAGFVTDAIVTAGGA